jgi:hypothetical protein
MKSFSLWNTEIFSIGLMTRSDVSIGFSNVELGNSEFSSMESG